MRLAKLAVLSFIFLFLVVFIISLFIPGNITISKATNVAGGDKIISTYFTDLSKWNLWYPALKDIPSADYKALTISLIEIRDTKIRTLTKNDDEITAEMTSNDGRPIISTIKTIRHAQGDSATLQWQMNFRLRWYPWEKFRSLFFENIYGIQMEQGLTNLKELSEGRRSSSN